MAEELRVSPNLLSKAIAQSSDLRWEMTLQHSTVVPGVDCSPYYVNMSAFADDVDPAYVQGEDGTTAVVALARGQDESHLRTSVTGFVETNGTLPDAGVPDALYYMFLRRDALETIAFPAGSKIDVWFPYVLDPLRRYSLNVAFVAPEIGGLTGSLHNNTLHFELPAFALAPGRVAVAQIDATLR